MKLCISLDNVLSDKRIYTGYRVGVKQNTEAKSAFRQGLIETEEARRRLGEAGRHPNELNSLNANMDDEPKRISRSDEDKLAHLELGLFNEPENAGSGVNDKLDYMDTRLSDASDPFADFLEVPLRNWEVSQPRGKLEYEKNDNYGWSEGLVWTDTPLISPLTEYVVPLENTGVSSLPSKEVLPCSRSDDWRQCPRFHEHISSSNHLSEQWLRCHVGRNPCPLCKTEFRCSKIPAKHLQECMTRPDLVRSRNDAQIPLTHGLNITGPEIGSSPIYRCFSVEEQLYCASFLDRAVTKFTVPPMKADSQMSVYEFPHPQGQIQSDPNGYPRIELFAHTNGLQKHHRSAYGAHQYIRLRALLRVLNQLRGTMATSAIFCLLGCAHALDDTAAPVGCWCACLQYAIPAALLSTALYDNLGQQFLPLFMGGLSLSWPIIKTDPRSSTALLYSVYIGDLAVTTAYGYVEFRKHDEPRIPLLLDILLCVTGSVVILVCSQDGMQSVLTFLPVVLSLCTFIVAHYCIIEEWVWGSLSAFGQQIRNWLRDGLGYLGQCLENVGRRWQRHPAGNGDDVERQNILSTQQERG